MRNGRVQASSKRAIPRITLDDCARLRGKDAEVIGAMQTVVEARKQTNP
jgi:hypothetical protein